MVTSLDVIKENIYNLCICINILLLFTFFITGIVLCLDFLFNPSSTTLWHLVPAVFGLLGLCIGFLTFIAWLCK